MTPLNVNEPIFDVAQLAHVELLIRIVQCAVKSHGSPVGETKQTHPGTIRSARNRLEG